ncbi:Uncharacterised protein [Bordetella pertussis]|nr:Uncharacterised protein [Bordetella pertussis]
MRVSSWAASSTTWPACASTCSTEVTLLKGRPGMRMSSRHWRAWSVCSRLAISNLPLTRYGS